MKKILWPMLGFCLLLLSGCSTCNRSNWPEQPVLDHLSVKQKSQYLSRTKQTLVNFRATADHLHKHQPRPVEGEPLGYQREQFHCEVVRYVEVYVLPILEDTEALHNVETRLGVAKVNLLAAYALYETGGTGDARRLLKKYDQRYRSDVAIETAMIDRRDMEFDTLGEAARHLRARLAR